MHGPPVCDSQVNPSPADRTAFLIGALQVMGSSAQTLRSDVCMEDGGSAECSAPEGGPYTYKAEIQPDGTAIAGFTSEQDLYDAVLGPPPAYCTQFLSPSPPFAWTLTYNSTGSLIWSTSLVETGTTGHCDGGPLFPFTENWLANRFQSLSCPKGWTFDSSQTVNYPYGYCFRANVQRC
jgi:hypothetical protein